MTSVPLGYDGPPRHHGRLWRGVLLAVAALAALLWVFLLNGRMLFYFDTAYYIEIGGKIIDLVLRPLNRLLGESGGASAAGAEGIDDGVNASRSFVYALIAAIAARLDLLWALVVAQAGLTVLMAWAVARTLLSESRSAADPEIATFLPLVVCGVSALPFYVAFFMPDLIAALGILAAALLAVYARQMRWPALVLAWCMVALSAQLHLSHLAMIALLVPVAAVVAPLVARRRWWLPPLLLGTAVAAGLLPLVAAKAVADRTPARQEDGGVYFIPILTARLVVDGPGLAYLEAHCPDPDLATCRLLEALGWSEDPYRLTASHIVFETRPPLASYRLLPESDQRAIAQEQMRFFTLVLKDHPLGVARHILVNSLLQAGAFSIDMTLPDPAITDVVATVVPEMTEDLGPGRLTTERGWVATADAIHAVVYALSLLALVWLLARPGPAPNRAARLFAAVVIAGILANALVCGGLSQPATRYGARTAWLLPYLATLLAVLAHRPRAPEAA